MKKVGIAQFILLLFVALGAGPAGAALWQWSLTPASNGTADPTINWAVGMAPSAVDPSARAMMARMAESRDDTSGAIAMTGTSTAYVIASNQASGGNGYCSNSTTAPPNGTQIVGTINVTNGASPTLAVDSCNAAPIQQKAGIAVLTNSMIAGTPYRFTYSVANVAWMLQGFLDVSGSPLSVPLGALLPYTAPTAPNSNYVLPAGQCLSTTTYAAYWALLGSPAPGSCSAGNFQIIDLRGNVLAGLDNLNGSAASRLTSNVLGCGTTMQTVGAQCANGSQNRALNAANMASYTPTGSVVLSGGGSMPGSYQGAAVGAGGVSLLDNVAGPTAINNPSYVFSGNNNGGISQAFPTIMPTVAVGYLLRVL